jgi:hypothetical protein
VLPPGLLGYRRSWAEESWVVIINFTGEPIAVGDGIGRLDVVLLSNDGAGEDDRFGGTVDGDQAVVLRA